MKKILLILVIAFVIGLSAFTVYNYNKSNTLSSSYDKQETIQPENSNTSQSEKIKAIDFKLKDLQGKEISLSDYKGKRVFLNFWASWCPPCKAEMPYMEKLYNETKNSDLVILAVDLGEDKSTVEKFIKDNNYNFKVLLDADTSVAEKYQIVSIPTSYFIDKEGNIVYKHIGAMTLADMQKYINSIK